MRPALPTASSKMTPSARTRQQLTEVHQQRYFPFRRQPPYPCLPLASSPLHQEQPHGQWGDQGKLIDKGHSNIRGCSGTVHMTTTLASHNNLQFLPFSSGVMNDMTFKLLRGGFIYFFIINHLYSISRLSDLSASNDVSLIFQGYIEEKNLKFLHS